MLKFNKSHIMWMLISIVVLGAAYRLIGFGSLPAGLNRDEAALGYNAFSLMRSGKDEWGMSWPIVFRSFGDYKLAGYIYTLIPFIAALGNTNSAVRLPSLFAGIALIPLTYIFVCELLGKKNIALLAALVQAVSPWAVHYSRIGFEANLALALYIASVTCLLRKNQSKVMHAFGYAFFFFSLLTYNAPLILVPCIVILFILRRSWRHAVGIVIISCVAFLLVLPATRGKSGITIFTDVGAIEEQHRAYIESGNNVIRKTLAHPIVFYPLRIVKNYISSFHPQFLVERGGTNPWHQPPGMGHMTWGIYMIMMLGILFAPYMFGAQSIPLYLLLFSGPLASAVTIDAPQATRMLFFLYMGGICAAVGIYVLWKRAKNIAIIVGTFILFESIVAVSYGIHAFQTRPQHEWFSNMKETLQRVESYRKDGDTIGIVGDVHYMYIYPSWYLGIDPKDFRQTIEYYPNDAIGLSQVKRVDHFIFASSVHDMQNAAAIIENIDGRMIIRRTRE